VAARGFYRARPRRRRIRNDPVQFSRRPADGQSHMLRRPSPISNAERQRQFRERNPGYYGRLHAKRRAAVRAFAAQRAAVAAAIPARPTPLLLPAPVELLVILGLNAIPATGAAVPDYAPVPRSRGS
jgi:hypothetical protein